MNCKITEQQTRQIMRLDGDVTICFISGNLPIVHIITYTMYKNDNVLPKAIGNSTHVLIYNWLQPIINTTFTVKNA